MENASFATGQADKKLNMAACENACNAELLLLSETTNHDGAFWIVSVIGSRILPSTKSEAHFSLIKDETIEDCTKKSTG